MEVLNQIGQILYFHELLFLWLALPISLYEKFLFCLYLVLNLPLIIDDDIHIRIKGLIGQKCAWHNKQTFYAVCVII